MYSEKLFLVFSSRYLTKIGWNKNGIDFVWKSFLCFRNASTLAIENSSETNI